MIKFQRCGIVLPVVSCQNSRKVLKPGMQQSRIHQISICNSKPKSGDRLLECHSKDCLNGKFFHLGCLNCKRIPNNSKGTWICNSCKGKPHKENDVSISIAKASQPITTPSTECYSSKSNSSNQSTTCTSSSPQDFTYSDDDDNNVMIYLT